MHEASRHLMDLYQT